MTQQIAGILIASGATFSGVIAIWSFVKHIRNTPQD